MLRERLEAEVRLIEGIDQLQGHRPGAGLAIVRRVIDAHLTELEASAVKDDPRPFDTWVVPPMVDTRPKLRLADCLALVRKALKGE